MLREIVGPLASWASLPLRLVVGVVFLVHGGQKIFIFGLIGAAPGFLTLLGGNLTLLLSGSGSYALDKVFGLEP